MRVVTSAGVLEKSEGVMAALEALRSRVAEEDRGTLEDVQTFIAEVTKFVSTMDGQLAAMRWLAQKQFRPKSDSVPPGQLALDLLGFMLAQRGGDSAENGETNAPPVNDADVPKPPPRERRKSKTHLIPFEQVRKEIPEDERICETCDVVKTEFDAERRRELRYEPSRLYFREELLVKYACRCCGLGVTTAPATPKLIEGSNVGASVLAHLVVSKVIDATPIERVGKQWSRHGYDIAPSTMHDWFGRSASELMFLSPLAQRDVLGSNLISFDDTPMPAKVVGHANGTQRGRLWLYIGDVSRVAYCAFTPDWKGKHPRAVLDGFSGHLQSDGYGGVAALFAGPNGPNKVGCNDHCRRKYVEALKLGDRRAARVVALYGELYAVERDGKDLGPDQRLALRRARSVPLWEALAAEIARLEPLAEPKSPLGKANVYFRRQNAALRAFLDHGVLPISNAHVERLLRSVALFRKNSLFVGSLDAGERYAALLTLAINCALVGANPFTYFSDIFERLAAGWPNARATDLMPQAWLAAQHCAEQVDHESGLDAVHD
jgi:transposase